jgi:O-antigen/teichoic acid export membrane protein
LRPSDKTRRYRANIYSTEDCIPRMTDKEQINRPRAEPSPAALPADSGASDLSALAGGASLSLGGKIGGRGLSFVGDIVAARILGPDSYGLYAIGWTILRTLSLISPLGLDKGVIFFSTPLWRRDPAALKSVLYRSLVLALLSGCIFGGALFLGAPWLAGEVFGKPALTYILRWYAIAFPLVSLLTVATAATRVTQRMQYSVGILDLAQPAVGLLLVILFYLLGLRLIGVLASDVLSFAIPSILAVYVLGRLFPGSPRAPSGTAGTAGGLLAFSVPASLAGVFTPFLIWVDRVIVGHFRTPAETGVYQAVSQTSTIFAIILAAFAAIFIPMISDLYARREIGRLEDLFRISTKWGLYISLPIFVTICVFPREILRCVFDSRYENGWLPLVILSVGQLVNIGTGAVGPLLVMTGHPRRWSILTGIGLAANICLNWYLVPIYGLNGAAISTALSLSGLFLVGVFQVRKSLRIWPYDRRYWKGFTGGCVSAVALLFFGYYLPVQSILRLCLAAGISACIFLAVIWALGLDREDREFIRLGREFLVRGWEGYFRKNG